MKKKYMILGCVAAVAIASTSIGGAWSYFTTYTEVQGTRTITLGDETNINEEYDYVNSKKVISISSDESSQPVYVRIAAFAGDQYTLAYEPDSPDDWRNGGDGYWYYTKALNGGETTSNFKVGIPETLRRENIDLNVVVVYESVPVQLDESGNALPYNSTALWSQKVNTGTSGTGGE